jgi:small membrane protein
MNPIQIILVAFFVFAAWRAIVRGRRAQSSAWRVVLWLLVWAAAIAIVLQPEVTTAFARLVGVTRGVDVPIYALITLLFYLVFRAFAHIEDVERQLTHVVRANALAELDRRLGASPAPPLPPPEPSA